MESLKKFSDYPSTPCKILSAENLARYNDYIKSAVERSRRMEIATREWASKNFIQFYTR